MEGWEDEGDVREDEGREGKLRGREGRALKER